MIYSRSNRTECIQSLFTGSRCYFLFFLFCYLANVRVALVDSDAAAPTAGIHPGEVRVGEVCAVEVRGRATGLLNCTDIEKPHDISSAILHAPQQLKTRDVDKHMLAMSVLTHINQLRVLSISRQMARTSVYCCCHLTNTNVLTNAAGTPVSGTASR
jgi:hypothetical protein